MILLLAMQLGFVGSQSCQGCHPNIYRSYKATPMAQSSGKVEGSLPSGSFRHAASGMRYRISGSAVEFERSEGIHGRREIQYFIGSGAAGRSFLTQHNGYLFQAPVTWYSQAQRWDISPGQEHGRRMRWDRPIEPNCLYCHASRPRAISGSQNRYGSPPFEEDGIACERCHGPGQAHTGGGGPIVNPSKLAPALRDDVCAQCHLTGEARVNRPGKQLALYRPGEALRDSVSFFVFEDDRPATLKATSHVEKLARSRCKISSGDRLWCGSCHDPHEVPSTENRVAWFRTKCLACHDDSVEPASHGADCIVCHMPRAPVADGGHGVLTDHSIPRSRDNPVAVLEKAVHRLAPWPGSHSDTRTLGLAYAELALTAGEPFYEAEAFRLLLEALPESGSDPELLTRLGWLHHKKGQFERAATFYERALAIRPGDVVAEVNLGTIYGQGGRLADAIRLWQSALQRNPALTEAARNLVTAWTALGEEEKAKALSKTLLSIDPDLDGTP